MHFMVYRYLKGVPFVKERYKKKGCLFWQKRYIKGKGWVGPQGGSPRITFCWVPHLYTRDYIDTDLHVV